MRRGTVGALILAGLLATQGVARAQFAFGYTRFGLNLTNPFVAQQQFYSNLRANRAAINAGAAVPAWLPYVAPYVGAGYVPPAYVPPVASVANPYIGYGGYGGYGLNPYAAYGGGAGISNPYSAGGDFSNPYSAAAVGGYGAYSNPAIGPGYALMGQADVMRAYGTVITSQEQARILRESYYQAKLDTQKKKFDLDQYIKANTPTYVEQQANIAKQILKRVQLQSSPGEVAEGRSLNVLIDDAAKYPGKTPVSEFPLDSNMLSHLNVKPAGIGKYSLGMLRNGGKLNWPIALIDMLPQDVRSEMQAKAQALAQGAITGKEPDHAAARDLEKMIDRASNQLLKKANEFGSREYMDANRFLSELENARRAIDNYNASAQVEFQKAVAKGDITSMNDLVNTMVRKGWRFAPALPADEAAYQALYSGLVSYDVALNQLVGTAE
jgi:hypothetical protein